MTRFSTPPDSNTRILPSPIRRFAFCTIGILAIMTRAATALRRAKLSRAHAQPPIFIYEPFGMGDIITLQPLVLAWLAAGRHVVLAAKPAWSEIIPPHPAFTFIPVSPTYAAPDSAHKHRRLFKELLYLARELKPHLAGSIGIDVRGDVRSLILLYLAGCATVRTLPRYYTANDCRVPLLAARRVELRRHVSRRLVNAAFAPPNTPFSRPTLSHLLPKTGINTDSKRVGLVPLTPWEGKRWIPERWREMILNLSADGFRPVVLCGPGEADAAIEAVNGNGLQLECLEANTVRDWVVQLAKCGSVITVNTGPMHIADALNQPIVVLEGPSRLPLWAPEGDRTFVVHHQAEVGCAPCHPVRNLETCGHRCMRLIRPEEVLSALQIILRQPSP